MPNERDAVRLEAPDDIALRIANEHTDGDSVIGDRPLWVNRDGLVTAIIAAIAAERSASEKRNEELVRELEVARHGWATVLGDVAAQVKFVTSLKAENERLTRALAPLVAIADAYDDDGLDEERPSWIARGVSPPHEGRTVELFSGRGGRQLLTLQHALDARAALSPTEPEAKETTNEVR